MIHNEERDIGNEESVIKRDRPEIPMEEKADVLDSFTEAVKPESCSESV